MPTKQKTTCIKVLIGLLLFYIALEHLEYDKLSNLVQNARLWLIFLALIITIGHILVMITIRTYLLNTFGKINLFTVLKTYFSTAYLTNILPARAGGILGEPWGLYSFSRGTIKFNDAFAFCLVITSSQNIRKIALTIIGLVLFFKMLPEYYAAMIILAVILYTGYTTTIISVVFLSGKVALLTEKLRRFMPKKMVSFLLAMSKIGHQTAASIKFFLGHQVRVVSGVLILLILCTLFEAFRIWILLMAFGVEFNFFYLLLIPSLAYSVTALPVSLGGFGITEISGLLVFKALGIAPEIALATTFLDRALSTYWTFLVGALLLPFIKLPRKEDFFDNKKEMFE